MLAVLGDGGMLMMLHDLVLIRELGLPIVIVVLSDRSLSLIRVSEERRGIAPYGVDFSRRSDFAAVAQAFGIGSQARLNHRRSERDVRTRLDGARPVPDRCAHRLSRILRLGLGLAYHINR